MAEHDKNSPDSSPPRAPSFDKSLTASRKVSPTGAPLPSPPDSAERARAGPSGLPQVLVDVLRELKSAPRDVDFYKTVPLSWEAFKSAREKIEATFRRFDYNPAKGAATIRMNSPTHDSFALSVHTAVMDKLGLLKNDDNATAKFVKDIRPMGSSWVLLEDQSQPAALGDDEDKRGKKGPDLQYTHVKSQHPGVAVEVAYTQQGKKLKKLAFDYIRGSGGEIRTVKAKLTLEEDGSAYMLDVHQDLKEVPFRSANREPLNQSLELDVFCLHDMTADKSLLIGVENLSISVPFKALYAFLDKAENIQRLRSVKQKPRLNGIPVKLAEPPSSSPEEELASADEKIFAEQEKTEMNKAKEGDRGVFHPVEDDIKGQPNVLTRSALKKRAAPPDNGPDLDVTKRRPGSKRRRG
ncbi:hypothetical protein FVER53590_14004 [Fusarium verticillioides]|nr:hypothetical protein FVER53590_14004 [Fusarium verticillioides]